MEMTYEELSSRLKDIDSKLDDLFSLIGKLTASRQCELMDVPAIAEMLGLSKRDIYNKKYLVPNFGVTPTGKMEWTRKEVEKWLETDQNTLKRRYLERAKENAM